MVRIPFDIKYRPQIERGEYKLVDNAGHKVRIVCWDMKSKKEYGYHLVGLVEYGPEHEESMYYTLDGKARIKDKGPTLFIETPGEELTGFECGMLRYAQDAANKKDDSEIIEITKTFAAELLALAREQLIHDGYTVEKQVPAKKEGKPTARERKAGKEDPDKTITLAGHTFRLRDIRFGLHSKETCDFKATLVCDGQRIGVVENLGQGGPTDFHALEGTDIRKTSDILADIRKTIWIRSFNGATINHDFGTVTDDLLILEDAPTPYREANGRPVWVSVKLDDSEENVGGLYIQIYRYPSLDCQVDYHCIDARTTGQGQEAVTKALQEYISQQDYL